MAMDAEKGIEKHEERSAAPGRCDRRTVVGRFSAGCSLEAGRMPSPTTRLHALEPLKGIYQFREPRGRSLGLSRGAQLKGRFQGY